MNIQLILFILFSAALIGAALFVIFSNNPVRSALFLVLAFFASAALWLLAEAEFLALILILVYVGAVMTLFLFVVMTINLEFLSKRPILLKLIPFGLFVAALLSAFLIYAFMPEIKQGTHLISVHAPADYSNTEALGSLLYTMYAYPFELAGVLLLIAIVAAITLSIRVDRNRKVQEIRDQISVKASERVRIIKMKSEGPNQ